MDFLVQGIQMNSFEVRCCAAYLGAEESTLRPHSGSIKTSCPLWSTHRCLQMWTCSRLRLSVCACFEKPRRRPTSTLAATCSCQRTRRTTCRGYVRPPVYRKTAIRCRLIRGSPRPADCARGSTKPTQAKGSHSEGACLVQRCTAALSSRSPDSMRACDHCLDIDRNATFPGRRARQISQACGCGTMYAVRNLSPKWRSGPRPAVIEGYMSFRAARSQSRCSS